MWRVAYILSASYVLVFFFFINIRRLDFILQLTVDALVVVVVVGCCCNSACVCIRNCWFMVFSLKINNFRLFYFASVFFLLYALTNKSSLKIDRPLPGACFFCVFFFFWLLISEAGGVPPFWLGFLPGRAGWVACFSFFNSAFSTTLSRQRGNLVKSPRLDTALFGRKKEAWTPRRGLPWSVKAIFSMRNGKRENKRERKGRGKRNKEGKQRNCETKKSTGKEREQKRGNREVETKEKKNGTECEWEGRKTERTSTREKE